MSGALFLLLILNFAYLGALPRIFFKKEGRFNLMWWVTAFPFLLSSGTLIARMTGFVAPTPWGLEVPRPVRDSLAVTLSVASIALMSFTLGTHRIPIALWHQTNDAPSHIVTWGAYGRIRHPFYSSFLMLLVAALLACPHVLTLAAFAWGLVILNATAAREEERMKRSEFGAEYTTYVERTGRFLPRLSP